MMILQKNRGISSYLEVTDIIIPPNYEINMLLNNSFKYVPETETREVDGIKSLYVKVDGLSNLATRYGRFAPCKKDVECLVRDIKNCLIEIKDYLLNPDGLVVDLEYILFSEEDARHKFMYVPGHKMAFREQIKNLFEEIMRMYDHQDRDGVVYLYEMYSKLLADNFTPELFCRIVKVDSENVLNQKQTREERFMDDRRVLRLEKHDDIENKEKEQLEGLYDEPYVMQIEASPKLSDLDNSLYILAGVAATIVAIVMFIFFGVSSFRFSALSFVGVIIYICVDAMHKKQELEIDRSMEPALEGVGVPVIKQRQDAGGEYTFVQYSDKLTQQFDKPVQYSEIRDFGDKDTSVLSSGVITRSVSRLIPCDGNPDSSVLLIEGETKIGRMSAACDHCINDSSISRVHAVIEKIGDEVTIRDVGSTNGTFVNETRLTKDVPQSLVIGDVISLAEIDYKCA